MPIPVTIVRCIGVSSLCSYIKEGLFNDDHKENLRCDCDVRSGQRGICGRRGGHERIGLQMGHRHERHVSDRVDLHGTAVVFALEPWGRARRIRVPALEERSGPEPRADASARLSAVHLEGAPRRGRTVARVQSVPLVGRRKDVSRSRALDERARGIPVRFRRVRTGALRPRTAEHRLRRRAAEPVAEDGARIQPDLRTPAFVGTRF